jgi:hypothetical protein
MMPLFGWGVMAVLFTCALAILPCAVSVVLRAHRTTTNPIYVGPPLTVAPAPAPAAADAPERLDEQSMIQAIVSINIFFTENKKCYKNVIV